MLPRHGALVLFVCHPKIFAAKDSFLISLKQINLLLGSFTEDSLAVVGGKLISNAPAGQVNLQRVGGGKDALRLDPEVPSEHLTNYFRKHLKLISNASAGGWISHAWEGI